MRLRVLFLDEFLLYSISNPQTHNENGKCYKLPCEYNLFHHYLIDVGSGAGIVEIGNCSTNRDNKLNESKINSLMNGDLSKAVIIFVGAGRVRATGKALQFE